MDGRVGTPLIAPPCCVECALVPPLTYQLKQSLRVGFGLADRLVCDEFVRFEHGDQRLGAIVRFHQLKFVVF